MSDAVQPRQWVATLSPRAVAVAVVERVEGVLRLSTIADAPAGPDPAQALAVLADLAAPFATTPPAAVVADVPVPLRVAAFAPRQDLYDGTLRPAVTALGCSCSGGGIDAPEDRRPGAFEVRLQQALDAQPDVLVVWDDGSEVARRWWAALEIHFAEARRQPPWAVPGAQTEEERSEPALLVVRSSSTVPTAPPTHLASWQVLWPAADGAFQLWRALGEVWRHRAGEDWGVGGVAPLLRAETLLWAARFFAAMGDTPVVLFDLDTTHVVTYLVSQERARVQRVPSAADMPAGLASWARGRLPGLSSEQLAALVERRWRGIPPAGGDELDLDLVLAAGRQGLLSAAPPHARLIATGRLAARIADPARIGLWLLEAARPQGCGLLCWDDANALSALAALAPTAPAIADAILADGCPALGTYLVAGEGVGAASLTLERPDGTTTELVQRPGHLSRLPLRPGEQATVRSDALGTFPTHGGPVGLVLDGRPRQREASLAGFGEHLATLRESARVAEAAQ